VRATSQRVARLEQLTMPEQRTRIVVLEQGETQNEALARLGISKALLDAEELRGYRILWVKWAG
jgi:hypothetical protein